MSDADLFRGCGRPGNDGRQGDTVPFSLDASLDGLVDVLADHRRRGVLYILSELDDGPVLAADLAQKLTVMDSSTSDIERLLIELHHTHLPKLAEQGLVRYDASSGAVHYTGGDRIERFLECAKDQEMAE